MSNEQKKLHLVKIWFVVVMVIGLWGWQGGTVRVAAAVETKLAIVPDKAFYRPGEAVTLDVTADQGATVEATIRYLSETVTTLTGAFDGGKATLTWTPPAESLKGYGVDAQVKDANGRVIASGSTAFDMLDRWIQAPRYGFLSNFLPNRPDETATMDEAAAYHVNGLQFYDWQYRHEQLLPNAADFTNAQEETYADVLGKVSSLATIKRLIEAAHAHNIAAMPYSAIYGASYAFYNQHPDWALFDANKQPFDFAGFLKIMDPTPGSLWATHLLNEYADVLKNTDFDGIHIDQYGAPMNGRNAAGDYVHLQDSFPAFIDATAALVHQLRGDDGVTIFNLVRNWPIRTVAPSDEDAVYIELWDPYTAFMDLPRVVAQAQALGGGKPVIIAAYIHPEEHFVNARLANALIFASGGYHLELGEPDAMLADAYFPKFGLMSDADKEIERRYYDFLVRYENVLALGTQDGGKDRAGALTIEGVETGTSLSTDRVAVVTREGANRETFSLVNLMGIEDGHWNGTATKAPTPLSDLTVQIQADKPVSQVWLASPDGESSAMQAVNFTAGDGVINFNGPSLAYWTMIVVEYE